MYTITRYTEKVDNVIILVQGVNSVFELKTNEEIGAYLKKLILSKYPSCRQFCVAYIDLRIDFSDDPQDLRSDEIRKLTNRLSQILKGKKSIQTYDLPIFSHLLDVSCEQMLTAGAYCTPISNRRTNYNIAFSKDEQDWIDYINQKDYIAAYADEFGKTVVDYAIEFKNYGFIRFLIKNGYITLVSDEGRIRDFNFGAETSIKTRPNEAKTLQNEFYENKILRTQIISMALENGDCSVLEEMRAREIPPQYCMTTYGLRGLKFAEYYDEEFIDVILRSKSKVIRYFCEEYEVESHLQKWTSFLWLYPFFDKLIFRAVKMSHSEASMLLDVAIEHNENAYVALKKAIFKVAQQMKKDLYTNRSFKDVIDDVLSYYHISEEKDIVSFYCYSFKDQSDVVSTNIIQADIESKYPEIQEKIERLNEIYNKIIDIRNHLIKNN